MALDAVGLLRRALDLQAVFDAASETRDWSGFHAPRVLPVEPDRREEDWTCLVELNRVIYEALMASSAPQRHTLADSWRHGRYPVFRRLTWFAARIDSHPSASVLLQELQGDPALWLWSPFVFDEAAAGIGSLWQRLPAEGRAALTAIVLDGPPELDDAADPESRKARRDHQIWQLLRALQDVGPLEAEALEGLSALQAAHPEWGQGETAESPATTTPEPAEAAAEAIEAMSEEGALQLVRSQSGEEANEARRMWRAYLGRDPARAMRLMRQLKDDDVALWSVAINVLGDFAVANSVDILEALDVLQSVPVTILTTEDGTRSYVEVLRAVAKRAEGEDTQTRALVAWDAVIAPALAEPLRLMQDRLTTAINSSAGIAAEALLELLWRTKPKRGSGVPDKVRRRLDQLLDSRAPSASLARVIIASRLFLLHEIDPAWTNARLIPLLDWSNPDEAEGAWQGYLWSPRVTPSLWTLLKTHFLKSFDNIGRLAERSDSLARVFASVAIEGVDTLTNVEAAECLRKMGDEGRGQVAFWMKQRLEGAGERAAILWSEQIGPWLERAWPTERGLHGPDSSRSLAWAALMTRDAFPQAVSQVVPRLGSLERPEMVLHFLNDSDHPQSHPDAALSLANAIVGPNSQGAHGLSQLLDALHQASPPIAERPEYERLRTIARQIGG